MSETVQAGTESATGASLRDDLVDIFIAPRSVFERRRDGSFLPALVVLTLVTAALTFPMQYSLGDLLAVSFQESMARSGSDVTPEQLEMVRRASMIGVAAVSGVTRGRAWVVAGVVWVLTALPMLIGPILAAGR